MLYIREIERQMMIEEDLLEIMKAQKKDQSKSAEEDYEGQDLGDEEEPDSAYFDDDSDSD
jgi:hypothetical protein